jgi:hypothetical protein
MTAMRCQPGMSIAFLLVAASSTATVKPAVVRFERPERGWIEHVKIVARDRPSHAHVTLTLQLATPAADRQEIVLPLEISHGVQITGMSMMLPDRMASATANSPREARDEYRQIKELTRDPALLEWSGSSLRMDRLTLRVFPVTKTADATITLDLEVAHGATLEIDPGPRALANVDVDLGAPTTWDVLDTPRTLALAGAIAANVFERSDERPHVDRNHSLLALPELSARTANEDSPHVSLLRDDIGLFEMILAHHTALEHCYALGRELDPLMSSRVDLVVRLAPNGRAEAGVGGVEIRAVSACLVDAVESWSFLSVSRTVTVRTSADLAHLSWRLP